MRELISDFLSYLDKRLENNWFLAAALIGPPLLLVSYLVGMLVRFQN
jgi:hypothetical protein